MSLLAGVACAPETRGAQKREELRNQRSSEEQQRRIADFRELNAFLTADGGDERLAAASQLARRRLCAGTQYRALCVAPVGAVRVLALVVTQPVNKRPGLAEQNETT